MISDLVIKVNVPSIRFFAVIDFPNPVDFESPRNRSQLLDDSLEVFLMKKDSAQALWTEIQLSSLPTVELNTRRNESIKRYHDREEEKYKETSKLKLE